LPRAPVRFRLGAARPAGITLAPYLNEGVVGSLDSDPTYYSKDMQTVEDLTVVPKTEHSRDGSLSSIESSPDPEIDEQTPVNESVQVQKRKGGRKPVCLDRIRLLKT